MKRLILGLVLAALVSFPATAQEICGDRKEIVNRLETGYLEKRIAMGLGSAGSLIELFVSKESGSFTLLITTPIGTTCLMAAGEDWLDNLLEENKGPAY